MIDQSIIRKRIQAERQALSREQQATLSEQICQQVLASDLLADAQKIAFYLPVRGEADPTSLQHHAQLLDRQFYLPTLSSTKQNHLEFALYNDETPMINNRFNIPEPNPDSAELLTDPKQLDAVVMPMVAIDRLGNRIGMGGGFYDRTFAFKQTEDSKPILIAFAYDFQLIETQTPQPWDVAVDAVALQSEFITP